MSIPRLLQTAFKLMFALLFIGNSAYALTVTVTSNADTGPGTFRQAVTDVNNAGAGPHTINFAAGVTSISNDYGALTLSNSNVTITGRYVGCDPDITITSPNDYFAFTITGSNVRIEGIKWRIRVYFQGGSGNSIYGCWFNMNDAGNAANGHVNNNLLTIENSTSMTVGGTTTCNQRNVFAAGATSAGQLAHAIYLVGTCTDLVISGNYIGTDKAGTTKIANNTGNGILSDAAAVLTNARITSNTIVGNAANGIYLLGSANGAQITGNYIGATAAGAAGATDLGNKKAGIRFEAATNSIAISNNVVIDNGQGEDLADNSGIYIYGQDVNMSNVTVSGNRAGVDLSNTKRGNDFSGIYIQRSGTGTMTTVVVSNNIVGDNGNGYPNKKSHGIAFRDLGPAAVGNLMVTGNYVGTTTSFTDIGNYGNGIEFYGVNGFTASGNTIGFNKFATTVAGGWNGGGIMVNGNSTNGTISGNYIGVSSTNVAIGNTNPTNAVYPNQMAGITLEQATGITITSNTIKNNNFGIQVTNVGSSYSTGNTITANTISNNTVYGIYIPGGNSNNIGNGTSGGANIISQNGSNGIHIVNTTSNNNKISQNQIFCNTGQGIKLNYGATQGNNGLQPPAITSTSGNTVMGTATAGASVEIFIDDPSCQIACGAAVTDNRREGKTYLTTVTANGSGAWTYTHSSALDANNISATATVGSNTSEFSICSIICPTAAAGSNQTLACDVTTTTLAATAVGSGETGTWTVVPANPAITFSDIHSNTATVSNLPTGTTTLRWTVSKTGCPDDFKDITITVRVSVAATASTNTTSVCSTSPVVNLTGSNPSPGTGLWTVVGGAATLTNPTSYNTATASITTSPATFRWTITNGTCTSFANTSAVTVTTAVTATASASATSVCSTSPTVNLTGNNPAPGTGVWTVTGGAATLTNATSYNTATATITTSPATFTWTTTNGPCTSSANTSAVTVTTAVTATASASASSVCSTSPVVNLTGNNPSPGTGVWTVVGGAATLTNPTSYNTATASITTSPATFRWTTTNGPCTSNANTSAVTVTTAVTATASVNKTSVCSSSPVVNLTGNNPSPGTGVWTVTAGTATLTNATSYNTATASITAGPATFTWTTTNSPCTSSANTSAVTLNTPVTPSATATSNVCSSSPLVVLNGNNPAPGTGTWTVTGGTVTFGNANSASTTATVTSGTSLTFTWTTTSGACITSANAATTVSSPVTATASSNKSAVCTSNPVVTLTGSNPSPGTGVWTVSGGTATFDNASNSTATATITSGTSLTFTWTITNGTCTTSASTSIITVSTPVNPVTATATSSVCSSSPVVSLTGSNPSPGTGLWTVSGGTVTFGNAAQESTTATVTSGTSLTFTWTVTNGPCTTTATATTTVNAAVTSNAGPAQALCNITTATLQGSNPSPGTGVWTVSSGTGSVTSPTVNNSGVTGLTIGASSTFVWTVTNGSCSATSSVTITVSAPGSISAGADQSVCQTNIGTVTLVGTGTGTWSTVTGTGVASSPSSSSTGVTGLTVGATTTFRWTVTSGACSGTDDVNVTVDATPVGSAGSNQALCNKTVTNLSATGSGTWSTVSGTGVVTSPSSNNSGVTGLTVGGSSTFRWTLVNGACSVPLDVIVTSSSPVTANGGSDVQVCNSTTANLSATGTGSWTATATMGTGTVTTPSNPSSGVTGLTIGTSSVFQWIVTSGACADTNLVTVTSYSPAVASAGPDKSLCNTTTYNMTATGTGTWSVLTGSGSVTTPTSPTSAVTGLTIGGSSVFVWRVTNGTCSATDSVTLSVSPGTTADAGSSQTLCNTNTTTLNATAGPNGTWLASTDATIANLTDPHSSVTVINSPATLTWQIDGGGCGNATATVTLTAVTLAKPSIIGAGSQACSGSSYVYTITNVDGAANYSWLGNPSSGITITPPTGANVNVSATASGKVMVFVSKLGCSDSASAVINVLPGPPSGRDTLKLATCIYTNYKIKTPLYDGFNGTWSSASGNITFTFNPADSTTTIDGLVDGINDTLSYTVSNTCGSVAYIFTIKAGGFFTGLEASGPSDTLCVSQARHLNALVTPAGNYTYYWVSNVNYNNPVIDNSVHIDSTTVPTYSVRPRGRNNIYFVYVVDKASQCRTDIDTAYIHAVEGQDLYVPNLITPNEDNMNDHWVLRDKNTGQEILPGSHFELYNRWGQRVFVMDNYDNRFKADHISDGIYYFNVKSGCGDKEYKGWLQILGNTNP